MSVAVDYASDERYVRYCYTNLCSLPKVPFRMKKPKPKTASSTPTRTTAKTSTLPAPREVRDINPVIQRMLWGKAAGRCEFAGCNKSLWKSSVTQEQVNIAQKAHIYAFSSDGPRGNRGVPRAKLNDLQNLMLVCHMCHEKIDKDKDGGRYSVAILQAMKARHERRIELVTGIAEDKASHVMLYGANIGNHSSPLHFQDAARSLFPERYPADDRAIELGLVNSAAQDRDAAFWSVESHNLITLFDKRVRERLVTGEVTHLSIFALAPQPLLILLGTLLTDIPRAEVFQLHREPAGWGWPSSASPSPFTVQEPALGDGPPALALSLSATITDDRIVSVLGQDARIWNVTIANPNNDFLKSRDQLAAFRALMRPLLDRIKARHGQNTPLHVFPTVSVSVAVELGRVRMPKADMPWRIYDQVNSRGGFVPALSIPSGD